MSKIRWFLFKLLGIGKKYFNEMADSCQPDGADDRAMDKLYPGVIVYIGTVTGDLQRYVCVSVNPACFDNECGRMTYTIQQVEEMTKDGEMLIEE